MNIKVIIVEQQDFSTTPLRLPKNDGFECASNGNKCADAIVLVAIDGATIVKQTASRDIELLHCTCMCLVHSRHSMKNLLTRLY